MIWDSHKKFCSFLDLKGRIIIAKEGINGTISGPIKDCDKYKIYIKNLLNIEEIDFKDEICNGHLFPKMSIKVKKEIIRMGVDVNPQEKTGHHLSPKEFKKMMKVLPDTSEEKLYNTTFRMLEGTALSFLFPAVFKSLKSIAA